MITQAHMTEAAKLTIAIPAELTALTPSEISRKAFDDSLTGNDATYEALCAAFDAVKAPYWKNAFYAVKPVDANGADASNLILAAIIFFHGRIGNVTPDGNIISRGYACD